MTSSHHDGGRIAVLWWHLEVAARKASATTTEFGWALLDGKFGHMSTLGPADRGSLTLDVFVVGAGPEFDRPR